MKFSSASEDHQQQPLSCILSVILFFKFKSAPIHNHISRVTHEAEEVTVITTEKQRALLQSDILQEQAWFQLIEFKNVHSF